MYQKDPLRLYSQVYDVMFPLELSTYNTCGFNCSYCFAQRGREIYQAGKLTKVNKQYEYNPTPGVINKFAKAMSDAYNPKDPIEYFIRHKYPVVYSNTTDPFCGLEAKTNAAYQMLTMFADYQFPVFLQTKNPYPSDDHLSLMEANKENMIVYVTIAFLDDAISQQVEKNTPPPSERLKKVSELVSRGFDVVVALNPYVDGMSPDVKEYVSVMADLGVQGIWFDYLHFNNKQKQAVTKIGYDFLIPYSQIEDNRKLEVYKDLVDACDEYGLEYNSSSWFNNELMLLDGIESSRLPYLNLKFDKFAHFSADHIGMYLFDQWKENGKKPLSVTWQTMAEMLDSEITKHVFSTHKWFNALNNSVTMSQPKYNMALGKENSLENILRYAWNNWQEILTWVWALEGAYVASYSDEDNVVNELTDKEDSHDTVMIYHPSFNPIGNQMAFPVDKWRGDIITL